MKNIVIITLLLALVACTNTTTPNTNETGGLVQNLTVLCPAGAKDAVCYEIYQPVCGSDGKTYANDCFACQKVTSYTNGTCASSALFTVTFAGGFVAPRESQTVFSVTGNIFTVQTLDNEGNVVTTKERNLTQEELTTLNSILANIGTLNETYSSDAHVADVGYADIVIGKKHTRVNPNIDASYTPELLALRNWISDETQLLENPPQEFTVCDHTAARGQMCTTQYDPVCAQVDNGIRCIRAPCPSYDNVTYSNACEACKNENVYGYTKGTCAYPTPNSKVGGDRDEHGCIPSAGYTWCDALQQCIRPWETNCTGKLPA